MKPVMGTVSATLPANLDGHVLGIPVQGTGATWPIRETLIVRGSQMLFEVARPREDVESVTRLVLVAPVGASKAAEGDFVGSFENGDKAYTVRLV